MLVSLYEKPMHPYEIAQTLRLRAKHESVRLNYGSLYAVVEGLERKNLIVARETVREGNRPPRTIYEITEDGSREMVDWLTDMIGVPAKEYPQFLAGLSFIAALTPEDALAALQLRAATLELHLAQIRATIVAAREAGLPRLFMVETEFEEQLIETELHFVSGLIKDMAGRGSRRTRHVEVLPHRWEESSRGGGLQPGLHLTNRGRVLRHATPDPPNHEIDPPGPTLGQHPQRMRLRRSSSTKLNAKGARACTPSLRPRASASDSGRCRRSTRST